MKSTFVRTYPPAEPPSGPAIWLLLRDGDLLVRSQGDKTTLIEAESDPRGVVPARRPLYLGLLRGIPCLADDLAPDDPLPGETQMVSLRNLYGALDEAEYGLAGYASQMLYWRRTSGFCPVCGQATVARDHDWGRRCPNCGHVSYPHVTPAVLILIHDGAGRILLGHKPGWGPRYSILAGFVEPGESLEDCVRREAMEEVGVRVGVLSYAGCQPWPFPHQLMIGFCAQYAEGEIQADAEELDDARWFTAAALPDLPPPVSLARQMIDRWVHTQDL